MAISESSLGVEAAPDDPSRHPPSLAGASTRYPRSLQVTGLFLPLLPRITPCFRYTGDQKKNISVYLRCRWPSLVYVGKSIFLLQPPVGIVDT